jgi:putative ABC transport system permease protein
MRLTVRRSEKMPAAINGGILVQAVAPELPATVRATVRVGSWFNAATSALPTVVLGDVAARRLGVTEPGQQVYLADQYHAVVGILAELPLSPDIARSALVGWEHARARLGFDGHPTTVCERSVPERVRVEALLAALEERA